MSNSDHELLQITPYDVEQAKFASSLNRRQENRSTLLTWIKDHLTEGVDFGRIHVVGKSKCGLGKNCKNEFHFSKPVLFKPGAEKICGMLGVIPRYPNLARYELAALKGQDLQSIVLHCQLETKPGWVLADGVGARSLQQDSGDLNKALKMAEKSAHIDATLRMAGLSELFTQDLEDVPPKDESSGEHVYMVAPTQLRKLYARLQGYDLPKDRVLKYCKAKWGVEHLEALTFEQFMELDAKLEDFAEKVKSERMREPISEDQLRKVMSFAIQHSVNVTEVLRSLGINALNDLNYQSLDSLWKALECKAERKAIQGEALQIMVNPVVPGSEAERLLDRAKQIRTNAKYADGGSYYQDLEEARMLENAARKLMQEGQTS